MTLKYHCKHCNSLWTPRDKEPIDPKYITKVYCPICGIKGYKRLMKEVKDN
jgi:transposase-like protein